MVDTLLSKNLEYIVVRMCVDMHTVGHGTALLHFPSIHAMREVGHRPTCLLHWHPILNRSRHSNVWVALLTCAGLGAAQVLGMNPVRIAASMEAKFTALNDMVRPSPAPLLLCSSSRHVRGPLVWVTETGGLRARGARRLASRWVGGSACESRRVGPVRCGTHP